MASTINTAIFEINKRSEKQNREYLVSSFVEVGALYHLLKTSDSHILYGRRGTGKTHIFNCVLNEIEERGDIGIYIDMRNIGSNGGLYGDTTISVPERASRLLIDTFAFIHDKILDYTLTQEDADLSRIGPLLDKLSEAIHQIQVVGEVELASSENKALEENSRVEISISQTPGFSLGNTQTTNLTSQQGRQVKGVEVHRIHFPALSEHIRKIQECLSNNRIWIFIDEWAEIPIELQPYLADLIRRSLMTLPNVIIKIAAIDRRTNLKLDKGKSYIGIEVGAELSSLNLDEFMVFENNSEKAKNFFTNLFYNHLSQILRNRGVDVGIVNANSFIKHTFTQKNAFDELVRAAEGVPRDAINIIVLAAMKANDNKISIPNIREAAHNWYTRDKEGAIGHNQQANKLLRRIIDTVIGERKARAFLLSTDISHPLIEYLYDARILHLVKSNISAKGSPGERYNVYAIDYGAYIHLINTSNAVVGTLPDDESGYVEIPMIDYRSIRRAILNIDDFEM